MALGSKEETREFNVCASTALSSFLAPKNNVVGDYADLNKVIRTESVKVRRLEEVLEELPEAAAGGIYLKLDTQGYDLEVLSGAGDALSRLSALQSEISVLPIYEGMPGMTESLQKIQSPGFAVTGLFPVNSDKHMRVVEFDCVALNGRLLKGS